MWLYLSLLTVFLTATSCMDVSRLEQKYQDYFLSENASVCLHKEHKHAEFRTFEEHDLTNYWGFFKLPERGEDIRSVDDITCQYCSGDGIYSLSSLLDFTLETVFDSLPKDTDETYRLGFFRMFPDRKVHRPYDAYLHHISGGARMTLNIADASALLGSNKLFFKMLQELCRLLSTDFKFSHHFVGMTIGLPAKDRLAIQIWAGPDMRVIDLRQLMAKLESAKLCSSPCDGFEGIKFVVEDPEEIEGDEQKINEIRSLFLANTQNEQTISVPLTADWMVLASSFPQSINGSFENARPVSQQSSIVKTTSDLYRIFTEKLQVFPGLLSKNSYTILFKGSNLPEAPVFTIRHLPALHNPFTIEISDLASYTAYLRIFRLVARFLTTTEVPYIDAVFVHLNVNERNPNPKQSNLSFEFWGKKHMNKNLQNGFRSSLFQFMTDNIDF